MKPRRHRRWPWIVGLLLLSSALGGVALASRRSSEPIDPSLVVTAARGPLAIEVIDVGRIEALHQVELESKVPGRVAEVLVEEGDRVRAGQPLIVLDTRDFGRAVAREQAELRRAEARVRFAALDRSRKAQGTAQGVVSQAELEVSEQSAALAAIDVSAARVAVATARDRLRDAKIVAPISGTVIRRAIEPGEMVVPGVESTFEKRSLVTIADLSALVVKIELNQIDVAQVKVGQRVIVTLDALPGARFEAKVREISPASIKLPGKELDVFPIEAVLTKADPRIKPGMTADVKIQVRQLPSVVTLPIETLRRESGKVFVTRVVDGERGPEKQRVEVVLGARNDRSVEVVSGIDAGVRVLIDPPSASDNETKM